MFLCCGLINSSSSSSTDIRNDILPPLTLVQHVRMISRKFRCSNNILLCEAFGTFCCRQSNWSPLSRDQNVLVQFSQKYSDKCMIGRADHISLYMHSTPVSKNGRPSPRFAVSECCQEEKREKSGTSTALFN